MITTKGETRVTFWRKVGEDFMTRCIHCNGTGMYEYTPVNGPSLEAKKIACAICHGAGAIKTAKREHVIRSGEVAVKIDVDAITNHLARIALRNKTGRATLMKGMVKAKVVKKEETVCP